VNPAISNMFDSLYFSVICVFTVGFGDVVPITSAGRAVAALTVLTSAVLVPLQLSEIVSATMQVRMEALSAKATDVEGVEMLRSPSIDTRDRHIRSSSGAPLSSSSFARSADAHDATQAAVLIDFAVECPRCHLRGHQLDARFCRNCAGLLSVTRSENFGT
jgi:Ion channel